MKKTKNLDSFFNTLIDEDHDFQEELYDAEWFYNR